MLIKTFSAVYKGSRRLREIWVRTLILYFFFLS